MDVANLDKLLSRLAGIFGEYSERAIIGGGVALLLYRYYFVSEKLSDFAEPATTDDFDMLVPRELPATKQSLGERLTNAGFKREARSLETPPVESYIGTLVGEEIAIEFLTDRRSRGASDRNVNVAGVSAQPLSYIEMSRESPRRVTTAGGGELRVVAPAPWMFHKALTFPRRGLKEKHAKDLYGIWYVGTQLGELSITALKELKQLGSEKSTSWKTTAKKNLADWISKAAPADWRTLEKQDPAQNLTEARFRRFMAEDFSL